MNLGDNNSGAVAGSFTLSAQLPNGKSLSFSGYVLQGESDADVNQKLDLAVRAVDRQRLIAEVPELETKLQMMRDAREQMEAVLAAAEGSSKSQDKANVNTARVNITKLDKDIQRGEAAIARAREAAAAAKGA